MIHLRNGSKSLPRIISHLLVFLGFVVAFLIAADKVEIVLAYASMNFVMILLFLAKKVQEKEVLHVPWQYELIRFLCILLPCAFFIAILPRTQKSPLGDKLIIIAIVSGMVWLGVRYQESHWSNRSI